MAAPPKGEVRIDAGGGIVELRRLTWMERTMRKMQAAKATGPNAVGRSRGGPGAPQAAAAASSDPGTFAVGAGCRMHNEEQPPH